MASRKKRPGFRSGRATGIYGKRPRSKLVTENVVNEALLNKFGEVFKRRAR